MEYTRTGIVLYTEQYTECVDFYSNIMDLAVMHSYDNEHSKLTTLDMGGNNYLMLETHGKAVPTGKSVDDSPVRLRFNVAGIDTAAAYMESKGVVVKIRREVWGAVADFHDPDGNVCTLREETTFGTEFSLK